MYNFWKVVLGQLVSAISKVSCVISDAVWEQYAVTTVNTPLVPRLSTLFAFDSQSLGNCQLGILFHWFHVRTDQNCNWGISEILSPFSKTVSLRGVLKLNWRLSLMFSCSCRALQHDPLPSHNKSNSSCNIWLRWSLASFHWTFHWTLTSELNQRPVKATTKLLEVPFR